MKPYEDAAIRAAIGDYFAGRGGYYSGLGADVYVRVMGLLQTHGGVRAAEGPRRIHPNPHVTIYNPPRAMRADALETPHRLGGQIAAHVHLIRYEHADDGEHYEHEFAPGVQMYGLPDGRVVLARGDHKPLWGDF